MKGKNYLRKLIDAVDSGLLPVHPGEVRQITIVHQDGCLMWKDGGCDCDPEIQPDSGGAADSPCRN